MTRAVSLSDIEEFGAARRIYRSAISEAVLDSVRNLNEPTELEPFLREILADPTDTAHGPAEIADIITTHVTYDGRSRSTAFVNKGKSTPRVSSRMVAHQIYRLRDLPHLDLIVLLAVGNIQDDARKDLQRVATDLDADYLIVDAVDTARLLVAYQKICPADGTPFQDGVCPSCGGSAAQPLHVTFDVYEEPRYELVSQSDISTLWAKRYRIEVIIDPHYSRTLVREVIKNVIWSFRKSRYHRSAEIAEALGDREADHIVVFVYLNHHDRRQTNWICTASWTNQDLPERYRPMELAADESIGDIRIKWSSSHSARRDATINMISPKEDWIARVEDVVPAAERLVEDATNLLTQLNQNKIDRRAFAHRMGELEIRASELTKLAEGKTYPPLGAEECDRFFYAMMGSLHNIFIPFASLGRNQQNFASKVRAATLYIEQYHSDKRSFQFEWDKVRSIGATALVGNSLSKDLSRSFLFNALASPDINLAAWLETSLRQLSAVLCLRRPVPGSHRSRPLRQGSAHA